MNKKERAEYATRLIARYEQLHDAEGWTQQMLADESGASLRTVQDFLAGTVPHASTVRKLGRALGVALTPEDVREQFPQDIKSFLNIVGVALARIPEERREEVMRALFERLLDDRPAGDE